MITRNRYSRAAGLALAATTILIATSHSVAQTQPTADSKAATSQTAREVTSPVGVLNLNTADEETLTRLPGIGPAKARAIISLRTRIKRFSRIEQLMRVRGIGRKTFRRLRPMLTLEGPTTVVPDRRPKGAAKPPSAGAGKQLQ